LRARAIRRYFGLRGLFRGDIVRVLPLTKQTTMSTLETGTETRGIDTAAIWQREYEQAKQDWPKGGPDCWQWHADEAVQEAISGYASVANY
jgi:hypothetical protein